MGTADLPRIEDALAILKRRDAFSRSAGAEVNSTEHILRGLKLSSGTTAPPFEMCFIVSETSEGKWAGKLLTRYYREIRSISACWWKAIPGLSPSDLGRLGRLGLEAYVDKSAGILRGASSRGVQCVINATGGFKAEISLAALVGQAVRVPVVHQFEGAARCIETPVIPLEFDPEAWLTNYDLFARLLKEREIAEGDFPFQELDSSIIGLLERSGDNGSTAYSRSPAVQLMYHGLMSRWANFMEEPPPAKKGGTHRLVAAEHDLDRSEDGALEFVRSLVKKFPWVIDVQNHSRGLDSRRCHLQPRTPDPAVHGICYSGGKGALGLSVITTARTERHVAFVRLRLAEFLVNG